MPTSDRYACLDSTGLLWIEALRAAQRQPAARVEQTQRLLQRMAMIRVDRAPFRHAGLLGPASMRSLDAIHLAAAMSLGPDLGVVITCDERMEAAAGLFGVAVVGPS